MFADRTNWNLDANRLSKALERHRAAGKPLLDLTISNPTTCGFQYDGQAILRALSDTAALEYVPEPKGLEIAREAVAGYYAARGVDVPVDDILLVTSTSEAYSFVFRLLCNPGDEILIPQPSYPLFDFLAGIEDVRLMLYPCIYDSAWRIDFPALEGAITPRTRGVCVVHPNNPTGHFIRPEEAARLNEICSARQLSIIADEVFLDFVLSGESPASFASNAGTPTFTLSGLSKICGLPQMKASWLVASGPAKWKSEALARLEVIADTYLSMNAPVQLAIPAFLDQRGNFQTQLMARVRRNLQELDRQLAAKKPCERLEMEGGWYAVLCVRGIASDEDLAVELLMRKDVYVHPGHFYDFRADGHLIVSLMTPEQVFAEGMRRLLSMF